MRTLSIICLLGASVVLTGCPKYTTPLPAKGELSPAQRNFDSLWRASEHVLRDYNFVLDRQDRRAGILTTEPMVGRHWFELWRHDAPSIISKTEDTLQTIYRIVEVRLAPTGPGAETYEAAVKVYTYRSDRPQPQITNTSDAYDLFSLPGNQVPATGNLLPGVGASDELDETAAAGELHGDSLPNWLVPVGPDGRDPELERVLSAKINARAE